MKTKNKTKTKFIDTENRLMVAKGKWGWRVKGMNGVGRHRPSVIRHISSGDVMYGMVTIINNAVLDVCKFLKVDLKTFSSSEQNV